MPPNFRWLSRYRFIMTRTFGFEPVKVGRVTGVSATPKAEPIAFQQVVPVYFGIFTESKSYWRLETMKL